MGEERNGSIGEAYGALIQPLFDIKEQLDDLGNEDVLDRDGERGEAIRECIAAMTRWADAALDVCNLYSTFFAGVYELTEEQHEKLKKGKTAPLARTEQVAGAIEHIELMNRIVERAKRDGKLEQMDTPFTDRIFYPNTKPVIKMRELTDVMSAANAWGKEVDLDVSKATCSEVFTRVELGVIDDLHLPFTWTETHTVVYSAIATLYDAAIRLRDQDAGERVNLGLTQIMKMVQPGNQGNSPRRREEINAVIEQMAGTRISLDYRAELRDRPGKALVRGYLLNATYARFDAGNGKVSEGWSIAERPPLMQYAADVRQVASDRLKNLESGGHFSWTTETTAAAHYIARRLANERNRAQKPKPAKKGQKPAKPKKRGEFTIVYDTLFKNMGIDASDKRQRQKGYKIAAQVLDARVDNGSITSWEEVKHGRARYSLKIRFRVENGN